MPVKQIEEELYGLLAEWIALRAASGALMESKPDEFRKVEIFHYFMPTFGRATYYMLKLGIYKKSKKDPKCGFHFATSRNMLTRKAVHNKNKGPLLEELLTCFFDLAGNFDRQLELKIDKAFKISSDRDRMFDLFMQLGYVRRQGDFYYWTPKVEVVMDDKYIFYDIGKWSPKKPFD